MIRGIAFGVSDAVVHPIRGVLHGGVAKEVGKGLLGTALHPVSGVLDFVAYTAEGLDASLIGIQAALSKTEKLHRVRLPRAIGADQTLSEYDERRAEGQLMLQLADTGRFLSLFGDRAKFAVSDVYHSHFELPRLHQLVVTNKRAVHLQRHPVIIYSHSQGGEAVDPCVVEWEVPWTNLLFAEVTPPVSFVEEAQGRCHLILHLRQVEDRIFWRGCVVDIGRGEEVLRGVLSAVQKYGPERRQLAKKVSGLGFALGTLSFPPYFLIYNFYFL